MQQVLSTHGDTHLGGEDFDQRVMLYFIKLFNKKTGIDIGGDNKATQKLRREVCAVGPESITLSCENVMNYPYKPSSIYNLGSQVYCCGASVLLLLYHMLSRNY